MQMRWNIEGRLTLDEVWDLEIEESKAAKDGFKILHIYKVAGQRRVIAIIETESAENLDRMIMVSGVAKGVEGILKRARTIVDYGAIVNIDHVVLGYEGAALLLHNTGKRNGLVLDEYLTTVLTLREGKIARLDTYISDIEMVNAYFS
jgi:uncharacterized protein